MGFGLVDFIMGLIKKLPSLGFVGRLNCAILVRLRYGIQASVCKFIQVRSRDGTRTRHHSIFLNSRSLQGSALISNYCFTYWNNKFNGRLKFEKIVNFAVEMRDNNNKFNVKSMSSRSILRIFLSLVEKSLQNTAGFEGKVPTARLGLGT